MSDNIEYKPFGQLLKKVVDNRGKTCPTASSGIPLIATNCIKNENLYLVRLLQKSQIVIPNEGEESYTQLIIKDFSFHSK